MSFVPQIGGVVLPVVSGVLVAVAAVVLGLWARRVRSGIDESRRQALTDDLTGLGNRRRLLIDLERAIAERHRPLARGARDVRPRRLQGLQRHARPPGRRRAARTPGHAPGDDVRRVGIGVPARRRRVLRAAARLAGRARGGDRAGARGAHRAARRDPLIVRVCPAAARSPRRVVGPADRRPAHVRAEGRPPRVDQAPGARPPARGRRPARPRPAPALRLGGRARALGGRASSRWRRRRSTTSRSPPTCTTSARW